MYRNICIIIVLLILLVSGGIAAEKPKGSFTWDKEERITITVTCNRVEGYKEFVEEMRKILPDICRWGSSSLLDFTKSEEEMNSIRSTHTIFMIRPENLEELEKLEVEYADLVPIAYSKLKAYSFPLLYFSRDDKGKIRGVLIADEVTLLLAKLLAKKELLLDTPFWFEDGQLEKIEEE